MTAHSLDGKLKIYRIKFLEYLIFLPLLIIPFS